MLVNPRPSRIANGCLLLWVCWAVTACTITNPDYRPRVETLFLSPGTLTPAFDPKTTTYSVDVDNTVSEVEMTATLRDADASMIVNGLAASSGQPRMISLNGSTPSTEISLVVTASNGNQNTYTVTVNRAPLTGTEKLQSLSVFPGSLTPAFDPSIGTYSVDVASATGEVAVTATFQNANAGMTVNGLVTSSGQARTIPLGGPGVTTPISVVVTAPGGSQNTYVVTVKRAAPSGNNKLQRLSVSPGSLVPTFDSGRATYSVDVAAAVGEVGVTAILQDANASMTVNGLQTSSGQVRTISLGGPGAGTPISVVVTAPNGSSNTYTVTVNRAELSGNNNLRHLSVSPGELDIVFSPATAQYFVHVGLLVDNVVVTALPDDSDATVVILGQATTMLPVPLGVGLTSIQILVFAPNGISNKVYTIDVQRGL